MCEPEVHWRGFDFSSAAYPLVQPKRFYIQSGGSKYHDRAALDLTSAKAYVKPVKGLLHGCIATHKSGVSKIARRRVIPGPAARAHGDVLCARKRGFQGKSNSSQ